MTMPSIRRLSHSWKTYGWVAIASSAGLGIPGLVQSGEALPVIHDFTVNVTEGSLAGMTFGGTFCYDSAVLDESGTGTVDVEDGLAVSMTFFGQDWTAEDDVDYPTYPVLALNNGTVEQLDFWVESPERDSWWNRPGWDITVTLRGEIDTAEATTDCPIAAPQPSGL